MKLLKQIAIILTIGMLFTSCSKEEESFKYSGMIGLWKMENRILQGVTIQMDPCQEKTLLNIRDSSFIKMTYSGLICDDIEYTESKYKMPTKAYYLNIPSPGDTTQIIIDKITNDELIIQYKSSDYKNPNIIEQHQYTKIKAHPLPDSEEL